MTTYVQLDEVKRVYGTLEHQYGWLGVGPNLMSDLQDIDRRLQQQEEKSTASNKLAIHLMYKACHSAATSQYPLDKWRIRVAEFQASTPDKAVTSVAEVVPPGGLGFLMETVAPATEAKSPAERESKAIVDDITSEQEASDKKAREQAKENAASNDRLVNFMLKLLDVHQKMVQQDLSAVKFSVTGVFPTGFKRQLQHGLLQRAPRVGGAVVEDAADHQGYVQGFLAGSVEDLRLAIRDVIRPWSNGYVLRWSGGPIASTRDYMPFSVFYTNAAERARVPSGEKLNL